MTNRKERRAARKLNKPSILPPESGSPPRIGEGLLERGKELVAAGNDEAALLVACRVILMEDSSQTRDFFVQRVKGWSYFPGAEEMQPILARALREAWTRPTDLLVTVIGVLERDRLIGPALHRASAAWPHRLEAHELLGTGGLAAVANHSLLLALLESLQIPDRRFERLLTTIRYAVLDAATTRPGP